MKHFCPTVLVLTLCALFTPQPLLAEDLDDGVYAGDDWPLILGINSQRKQTKPPGVDADPAAAFASSPVLLALGATDQRLSDTEVIGIRDSLVESIEQFYIQQKTVDAPFIAWLKERPIHRREFWLGIHPYYDDVAAAANILLELAEVKPDEVDALPHLAIATALVFDSPEAANSSRMHSLWGVNAKQFIDGPDHKETFAWFSHPQVRPLLAIQPDKLVWPLLVQVVDFALPENDRSYAISKLARYKKSPAGLYDRIYYDMDKITGDGWALGADEAYTLENLSKRGGVCVDQAYATTRTAKAFAIPAIHCVGIGASGVGHAWSGYVRFQRGEAKVEFTGRYLYEMYYVGDVFDPQTRTMQTDREIAQLLAAAWHDFDGLMVAKSLARAGTAIFEQDPERSIQFAKNAIEHNHLTREPWRLLMRHAVAGNLPLEDVSWLMNTMAKALSDHPDQLVDTLLAVAETLPELDDETRARFYDACARICVKRPDLILRLRQQQSITLIDRGMSEERNDLFNKGLTVAAATLNKHGNEAAAVLPFMEAIMTIGFRVPTQVRPEILKMLKKARARFPWPEDWFRDNFGTPAIDRADALVERYEAFMEQ